MTSEIDSSLTAQFAHRNVPLVFLDVGKPAAGVSNIRIDYAGGITQAVTHLLDLGHTEIAFISGPLELKSARERRTAFLSALRVLNRDDLVEEGNHRVDGGVVAITRLLERPTIPSAV